MTPVAIYRERQIRRAFRRTFYLYDDRIVVRDCRLFGDDIEQTADLVSYAPDPDRLRIRGTWFKSGLTLLVFSIMFGFVIHQAHDQREPRWGEVFMLLVGMVGLLLIIFGLPRVVYARFRGYRGSSTQPLDVAQAGPDRRQFGEFVNLISNQIRRAHETPQTPVAAGKLQTRPCMACGYDLTANVSGVCPECGVRAW